MRITLTTGDGQHLTYSSNEGFASHSEMPCLRCGVCCTKWQPPVGVSEARCIARGLGISYEVFKKQYLQKYPFRAREYLIRRENEVCVFLRLEGNLATCAIHEHRPEACRNWKPSLKRRECQEGLRRQGETGKVLKLGNLPLSPEEISSLCCSLIADNQRES